MAESLVRKKCSVLIWLLWGKGERNMTHTVYLLCAEFSRILLNLTEPYEGDTLLLPLLPLLPLLLLPLIIITITIICIITIS